MAGKRRTRKRAEVVLPGVVDLSGFMQLEIKKKKRCPRIVVPSCGLWLGAVTELLNFEKGFSSGVNSLFSIDLGIRGSEMFAEMDLRALKTYQILIKEVGLRYCVDPALIAAIISRESHGGTVLQDGWDHRGLKFGLMQVVGRKLSVGPTLPFLMEAQPKLDVHL